jgi:hypothetical protein
MAVGVLLRPMLSHDAVSRVATCGDFRLVGAVRLVLADWTSGLDGVPSGDDLCDVPLLTFVGE